jgi:hypothetical protein
MILLILAIYIILNNRVPLEQLFLTFMYLGWRSKAYRSSPLIGRDLSSQLEVISVI